ncbi:MAG: nodulation protein NfeD [bacterium]|nr:nodulation protein NfeD [bacterium]
MKFLAPLLILFGLALQVSAQSPEPVKTSGPLAFQVEIQGPIGPATSSYFERGLEKAQEAGAQLLILRMDTPGGLDTSMRVINKAILSSPIPVVAFVAPEGARAASAGTYILYASHIAAMAPATNLGAATPVQLGGLPGTGGEEEDKDGKKDKTGKAKGNKESMRAKAVNDAKAYIRSLAQKRGRNVKWAEQAVVEAESLPAEEALKIGVIDLIANNTDDLIKKLNGYQVAVGEKELTLQTEGMTVSLYPPGWRFRLLNVISNPNIAYILLMIGIYGLIFEFMNPGYIVPGVVGAICLLLGLYALHVLPVNYTGVALILLGIALMVTEAFVPSFGALGIGGVVAFVIGSLMLMDTESVPGLEISRSLIATVAVVSAAFFILVVGMAVRARRRKVVSGSEEMIGAEGRALEDFNDEGNVFIHSETWRAKTNAPIFKDQRVRVTGREGLLLFVEPLSSQITEE